MYAPPLQPILEFAVEAAQLAGSFTLGYFNAGTPHELKADRSPVTRYPNACHGSPLGESFVGPD